VRKQNLNEVQQDFDSFVELVEMCYDK
jgi:hypothetical protein